MLFSVVYSSISGGMVGLIMTNEKWEETLLICVSIPGFWAPQKSRSHRQDVFKTAHSFSKGYSFSHNHGSGKWLYLKGNYSLVFQIPPEKVF